MGHFKTVISTMEKLTQCNGMERDEDRGGQGSFRGGHLVGGGAFEEVTHI